MLKIIRVVLSIIALVFAIYGLFTRNVEIFPYLMLLLGLTLFVMGVEEYKRENKAMGVLLMGFLLFSLFIFIKGVFY